MAFGCRVFSHIRKRSAQTRISICAISFTDKFAGSSKAGQVAVLEEGIKWQSISVSPEDAELLASRRFGTETIAGIFRVPLPMLGDISNGSYANVVELNSNVRDALPDAVDRAA